MQAADRPFRLLTCLASATASSLKLLVLQVTAKQAKQQERYSRHAAAERLSSLMTESALATTPLLQMFRLQIAQKQSRQSSIDLPAAMTATDMPSRSLDRLDHVLLYFEVANAKQQGHTSSHASNRHAFQVADRFGVRNSIIT